MPSGTKCLVHGCQNYSTQGVGFYLANETGARYAPFICSPCVDMLTRGSVGTRKQTFIAELQADKERWRQIALYAGRAIDLVLRKPNGT